MNAAEHFDWAVSRAMAYVDEGDAACAMAALILDLGKHEGTANILSVELTYLFWGEVAIDGVAGARWFIEGLPRPADGYHLPEGAYADGQRPGGETS